MIRCQHYKINMGATQRATRCLRCMLPSPNHVMFVHFSSPPFHNILFIDFCSVLLVLVILTLLPWLCVTVLTVIYNLSPLESCLFLATICWSLILLFLFHVCPFHGLCANIISHKSGYTRAYIKSTL